MNIPTWKPKQFEGSFDFTEENFFAALEKVKELFLEYDGVITLRRSNDTLNFGAILHEREETEEESPILETEGD